MTGARSRWAVAAIGMVAAHLLLAALLAPHAALRRLCEWDCGWYLQIARSGYVPGPLVPGRQADWAFFPLFPLLVRGTADVTGAPLVAAGVAVAAVCFLAFAVLGAVHLRRTGRDPALFLLLLLCWPMGFYFVAPYSEAPFAALATAALALLSAGRPGGAALAGLLLSATRPTGILLVAPVALARRRGALLRAVVAAGGLALFMLFLLVRTGDALAFLHVQAAWEHRLRNPLAVLADPFRPHVARALRLVLLEHAGWAVAGVGAAFFLTVRGRGAEALLCGGATLAALLSGSLMSLQRYVGCNPAFLFAATEILAAIGRRPARSVTLAFLAAWQIGLTWAWLRGADFLL